MNKEFTLMFLVNVRELPRDYSVIVKDCKEKCVEYFGTRNVQDEPQKCGLHVYCEVTREDTSTIRGFIPDYVELAVVERVEDTFTIVDL